MFAITTSIKNVHAGHALQSISSCSLNTYQEQDWTVKNKYLVWNKSLLYLNRYWEGNKHPENLLKEIQHLILCICQKIKKYLK